jgi:Cysteine-rich CPXCG
VVWWAPQSQLSFHQTADSGERRAPRAAFPPGSRQFIRSRNGPISLDRSPALCEKYLRMEASFQCAGCGEWNPTSVDESAGQNQSYIEDCQVCCNPNLLRIHYRPSLQAFVISADLE